MSKFIELHLIQNFAPSNLNRDDTGAPKSAIFGGFPRARVSSQCFKRTMRLYSQKNRTVPEENDSVRTRNLSALIAEQLPNRDGQEAQNKIRAALKLIDLKLKDDGKTEYLLFLGKKEISEMAILVDENWDLFVPSENKQEKSGESSKKIAKQKISPELKNLVEKMMSLLDGTTAIDVALYGRMLADKPTLNVEAACQVAHAISTNAVERDFDFFTAVDDEPRNDEAVSGMLGQIEFNSPTYYRYIALDVEKLLSNLHGDKELVKKAVSSFIRSAIFAVRKTKWFCRSELAFICCGGRKVHTTEPYQRL